MRKDRVKVAVVVGTRPEIIKMSPIIRQCEQNGVDYFIIHTGQHYSYNMDQVFFEDLELPRPKYHFTVGSGFHGEQTGKMLTEIEKVLINETPDVLLVEGDTNTVLAGALAAVKLHIDVGHVEAGLRSYDRIMPEEINRVLTDHISNFLFAPTEQSKQNLLNEGIDENKIFVTGNTIVDAVNQNLELSNKKTNVMERLRLTHNNYFLVTTHRSENVDDKERFQGILSGLQDLQKKFQKQIIFPIHPRSRKKMDEFGLSAEGITFVEPQGIFDFLQLENHAKLILTDSGGVQEEACILGIPCVTLRKNTERPETIEVGLNMLAGTQPDDIVDAVSMMVHRTGMQENPFGSGTSGSTIMKILINYYEKMIEEKKIVCS
jgi:UDP-N-acetylglucosamine 2-epimerase (non-hydrolysing)